MLRFNTGGSRHAMFYVRRLLTRSRPTAKQVSENQCLEGVKWCIISINLYIGAAIDGAKHSISEMPGSSQLSPGR